MAWSISFKFSFRSVSWMHSPKVLFFSLVPHLRSPVLRRTMMTSQNGLDEPSWSRACFSKMVHKLIFRRKRKKKRLPESPRSVRLVSLASLKVAHHEAEIGRCSLSVRMISWSYCEIWTHDGFSFKCCWALPHNSLYVIIMNLELLFVSKDDAFVRSDQLCQLLIANRKSSSEEGHTHSRSLFRE